MITIIICLVTLYTSVCGMVICYLHGRSVGEKDGWNKGLLHIVKRYDTPLNVFKPLDTPVPPPPIKKRLSLWSHKETIRGEK